MPSAKPGHKMAVVLRWNVTTLADSGRVRNAAEVLAREPGLG